MPAGWSRPPAKLRDQKFRRKDPNLFLVVTGDFNGDGIQDKALLRVNQTLQLTHLAGTVFRVHAWGQ
jgi:hypothetical protein